MTDATDTENENDRTRDLSQWEVGATRTMTERADGQSDGLYADLPSEDLLARFDPKQQIRAAAWNADGDQVVWTARVHKSGDCIAIPEKQRRMLDLEAGDEIVWGVAPLDAPTPDFSPERVATNNVHEAQITPDFQLGAKPPAREEPAQATLEAATIESMTSEVQESLRSDIKSEISRARFEDDLSWSECAGVLEDVLVDVAEQAQFDN